jgi:UDP-GlcNAc3NAcA epimerase
LSSKGYYLATVHRPYNTDDAAMMNIILEAFGSLDAPVVFPVHPRTLARISEFGIEVPPNVQAIPPVGYLDMLVLQRHACVILTDSGGVQKEACFAGTPCVTLRPETEWVETVESGWNMLAWGRSDAIVKAVSRQKQVLGIAGTGFGDGNSAVGIASRIQALA